MDDQRNMIDLTEDHEQKETPLANEEGIHSLLKVLVDNFIYPDQLFVFFFPSLLCLLDIHPLWQRAQFPDGTPFYYNDYSGAISLRLPVRPKPPRGGILADDQGLGKTIQVRIFTLE